MKPNALTRCWDVYPKGEIRTTLALTQTTTGPYSLTSSSLHPYRQLTYLEAPMLRASILVDIEQLWSDILSSLPNNPVASPLLSSESLSDPCWTISHEGFLLRDNHIFIPEADNLCLQVLQTFHNHPTAGHFGQN